MFYIQHQENLKYKNGILIGWTINTLKISYQLNQIKQFVREVYITEVLLCLGVDEEMLHSVKHFGGGAWKIFGCQFLCQLSGSTLTSQEHHNVNLFSRPSDYSGFVMNSVCLCTRGGIHTKQKCVHAWEEKKMSSSTVRVYKDTSWLLNSKYTTSFF